MRSTVFFALVLVLMCSGCAGILSNIDRGTEVRDDKVIMVGKISFDPPILQKRSGLSIGMANVFYSLYNKDVNKKPITAIDAEFTVKHHSPGYKKYYYFIVKIPRKYDPIHLTSIHSFPGIVMNGTTHLEIFPKLLIPRRPDDRFIYIGNIVVKKVENRISIEIIDEYEYVKKRFQGHVLDKGGHALVPRKCLVKQVGPVSGRSVSVRYQATVTYR